MEAAIKEVENRIIELIELSHTTDKPYVQHRLIEAQLIWYRLVQEQKKRRLLNELNQHP